MAVVNNFVATSANIGFAVINDGMIAAGAVTNSDDASGSGSKPLGSSGWNTVGIQTTVASPSGNPVMHFSQGTVTGDLAGITIGMRIVHVQTGNVLRQQTHVTASGNMSMTFTPNLAMYALGTGTHTIRIEVNGPAATAYTASLIAQCNKK